MSVGADSLMAFIDMTKLLNKEILEKGRVKQNVDNAYSEEQTKTQEVNHEWNRYTNNKRN